ncbi:Mating-type regulated component of NHEJ [Saccharomyces cerevisiae]|nr:Nej1p [Saccharomyces cerevisiae YJM1388]AJV59783.1 Nej1p [Saccharomyces cerevisiae YJM1389]AJV71384.1 Nej1p [Saccharomyces cerevisiae YJM1592]CAI4641786.1 ALH_1c_G0037560.mRNA.1.CDS.1 [Saccharomyces cerevisiae]CAI4660435.1 CEL_1a_G0037650.mRNA.1.CDS.1 [Saccharomyces cerevisiae]
MDSELKGQQLSDAEWCIKKINGEGNCLLLFLPMSSPITIVMIVLVSLERLVPYVFKLSQTQLSQQCQSQGFTDSISLNLIKLKLMDILQAPQEINQIGLVDSNLVFSFDVSADITVSINSVPSHVTKDMFYMILQSLCMLLLKLVNLSTQYHYVQRDILNEKQKCLDFLLISLRDLDGGSKVISQWAPENSKNYESLQQCTDDDIIKKLLHKGKFQHQEFLADSLKTLLSLRNKFQDVSRFEESGELNKKERVRFPAVNHFYNDDFELQADPTNEARPNSRGKIKPKTDFKPKSRESSTSSQLRLENFSESEATPEKTKSSSSLVEEYPQKKRKFGKVRIKN